LLATFAVLLVVVAVALTILLAVCIAKKFAIPDVNDSNLQIGPYS